MRQHRQQAYPTVILHNLFISDKTTGEKYALADFDEPARELFIWSVLMNRLDMAMHFWDEGRVCHCYNFTLPNRSVDSNASIIVLLLQLKKQLLHPCLYSQEGTAAALVAQKMLKSMLAKTDDSELIKEIAQLLE